MIQTALLLVPDFAMIALGVVLMRFGRFDTGFWIGLERLVYFLLFPALLFYSIVRTPLDFSAAARLLQTGFAVIGVGIALGWAARLARPDPRVWASAVQCAFRFNSYVALALAGRLGGDAAITTMALLVGVGVPTCNAFAVYALAKHSDAGLARELVRNPLLVATITGLVCSAFGLTLPDPLAASLSRLGNAAIALGLIAVGAGLRLNGADHARGLVAYLTAVKLLALPATAWVVGRALGLAPLSLQIVVVFAALPTASSAYILAQRMGGDGKVVAVLISFGTLVSAITIPAWLTLARG